MTVTMNMTMTRGRGRGRSRSRNLCVSGAGAGNFKNGRLRQPCNYTIYQYIYILQYICYAGIYVFPIVR